MLWGLLLTLVLCTPSNAVIRVQPRDLKEYQRLGEWALKPVPLPKTSDLQGLNDWLGENGHIRFIELLNFTEATTEELASFHYTFFSSYIKEAQLEQVLAVLESPTARLTPTLLKIKRLVSERLATLTTSPSAFPLHKSCSSLTDGPEVLGSLESSHNSSGMNIPRPKDPSYYNMQGSVGSSMSSISFTFNDYARQIPRNRKLSVACTLHSPPNAFEIEGLAGGKDDPSPNSHNKEEKEGKRKSALSEESSVKIDCIFGDGWESDDDHRPSEEKSDEGSESYGDDKPSLGNEEPLSFVGWGNGLANLSSPKEDSAENQAEDLRHRVSKVSLSTHIPSVSGMTLKTRPYEQGNAFSKSTMIKEDSRSKVPRPASKSLSQPTASPRSTKSDARHKYYGKLQLGNSEKERLSKIQNPVPVQLPGDDDDNIFDEETLGVFSVLLPRGRSSDPRSSNSKIKY